MKKILSLLIVLLVIAATFTGCFESKTVIKQKTDAIEKIPYTLDENSEKNFSALLKEVESISQGDDLEAANDAIDRLDEAYMDLIDQSQIAYVRYCTDQTDEEWKQQHLYAEEVVNQAEADYNAMLKRVYLSECPLRDELFADWTQEEIDMMLAYNEEIKELNNRNTQITTEFRELDTESESWGKDMVKLYNETVKNNNRIAEIYGYENYYVFASQMVYQRDYDSTQLQNMRHYVAEYFPDCHEDMSDAFSDAYDELSDEDREFLSQLMYTDYDELPENYVALYIADMPQSSQEGMLDLFDGDRSVFTDNKNAYEGAFTTFIDGAPFCFFGPGYFNSETVVHELGHYYGSKYVEPWSQPMDLAETQSQGNEWLYIRFLKRHVSTDVYESMVEYKLMSTVGEIMAFVMIDEFEQLVYSHENAGELTLKQYDKLMEQVAENYGGIEYFTENVFDIQLYWKYVVLESPVYYISYAVSGVAAINLFTIAEENEENARSIYCKLLEQPQTEEGFLENITHAGLSGPFEETVYEDLCGRYRK